MWRVKPFPSLAHIGRALQKEQLCKTSIILSNLGVRNYWNKDWAADPKIPQTEAERAAAAKKYGLLPQDYKPYPEDDAFGDYPHLPDKGVDSRDPWEDYDMPSLRRNFGDPIHFNADIYGEDRYQPDAKYFVSMPKMWLSITVIVGLFFGLGYLGESYKSTVLIMEKQLPYQYKYTGGEEPVHYTFNKVKAVE